MFHELLDPKLHRPTLEDSIRGLAGTRLTAEVIAATSWRLVGALPRLRERWVVAKWGYQQMPEWVPVQITSCRRERNSKGALGASFAFRILAGTPAGLLTRRWWSLKQCRYFSTELGFHKPARGETMNVVRLYTVPEQFVNLHLYVLITPELSGDGPGFDLPAFPTGVRPWNLEIVKRRLRVDAGYGCPQEYPNTFPCHLCPIGYAHCSAATHQRDWVERACPVCNNPKAWFEPDVVDSCVDCTIQAVYKERT